MNYIIYDKIFGSKKTGGGNWDTIYYYLVTPEIKKELILNQKNRKLG